MNKQEYKLQLGVKSVEGITEHNSCFSVSYAGFSNIIVMSMKVT